MTSMAMGIGLPWMGSRGREQATARLAWFLAGAYPGGSKDKRIARDFGVSVETAKAWRTGRAWPSTHNFIAMTEKWGRQEFIKFIYGGNVLTPKEMEHQARAAECRSAEMMAKGELGRAHVEAALQIERMALALGQRNSALGRGRAHVDMPGAEENAPEDWD